MPVTGGRGKLSIGGQEVAQVSSWSMGHVPPSSPVTRMASCEATLRNMAAAERLFAEVNASLADQDRIERNLAATGREPLPSELKVLGKPRPRKITLEDE